MINCISLELSKKLQGLLEDRETEYFYNPLLGNTLQKCLGEMDKSIIKTLTLEEATDFLPIYGEMKKYWGGYLRDDVKTYLAIEPKEDHWEVKYIHWNMGTTTWESGKTLLEAIEAMIEYLLDNNLLPNNKE